MLYNTNFNILQYRIYVSFEANIDDTKKIVLAIAIHLFTSPLSAAILMLLCLYSAFLYSGKLSSLFFTVLLTLSPLI